MPRNLARLFFPLLGLFSLAALAATEDPFVLDPIVVVASKRPQPLSEAAGQVSVLEGLELAHILSESLAQVLRYEPGVDASAGSTRFGTDQFIIRGIGGNRVAIEIDGVPMRKGFMIGSYSNAGRALLEPDRIKRLEILHGPASVLFGSDALGGVLSFTTWDPDDLVARGEGPAYLGLGAGYQSADSGRVISAQGAWADGSHGLLASLTLREGHERQSAAVAEGELDPQTWRTRDFSAKYTYDTSEGHRARFIVSRLERDVQTNVRSLLGYGRFARTTELIGIDSDEWTQAQATYDYNSRWFDSEVLRGFVGESKTRQRTDERRRPPPVAVLINRDFQMDTRNAGLEWNGFRRFESDSAQHLVGMGVEVIESRLEELRDGLERNLETGTDSRSILGEQLPTRDFPVSTTREIGLFVEDSIQPGGDSPWEITPALRFESFRLRAESDPIYAAAFPEAELVSSHETRLSPRLAVSYQFSPQWRIYGQYTQGFRAPPVEDVNIGFELPLFGYRAIPNPDLKPEVSRGFELGLRHVTADRMFAVTWFDTYFENLIESRALRGLDEDTGYLEFQSRNIGRAHIYGADLRYEQSLTAWHQKWSGWRVSAALSWTRGNNLTEGQPLNSLSPPQAVIALSWASPDGRVDATLLSTLTAAQDRVDETAAERFIPAGWQSLDFVATWRPGARYELRVGLFNLTDQTYWYWQDVRSLAAGDPMIPLLAQPGRNIQLRFSLAW